MSRRKQSRTARRKKQALDEYGDNEAFYDDQYDEAASRPKKAPSSLSHNPIITVLERSLRQRGVSITALRTKPGEIRKDKMRQFIERVFGDEAIRDVGTLTIENLVIGDGLRVFKRAIKEANHVFRRDRELVLLECAFKFVNGVGEGLDVVTQKTEIEKRFNKGKPLHQHQWNRLRNALFLAKLPTGAPRKSGTKRR